MQSLTPYLILLFLNLPVLNAVDVCRASYPAPKGYVNDFAGVMDERSHAILTGLLSELEQKANAQVAVAAVTDLGGQDIGSYATGLYEAWEIGKKGTDRGALILVSIGDKKGRIETGYGLEGILPDGLCGQIMDEHMVPFFKEGRYAQGILRGATAAAQIVANDAGVELTGGAASLTRLEAKHSRPLGRAAKPLSLGAIILRIIFIFILAIVFIRHPFLFLLLMSGMGRGGFGGGFGSGFGGFGGGLSGGGGASRSW